ncbi:MAG: MFS transporter [Solirubrobacterales bacterium]|nr:MFS transporter [Solirubrobacterales bacterium]
MRRIVAAYTVNRLGTWFGFIALSIAVFDYTHSAIAVGALLLAGQVLPAFVVPVLVARVETSVRRGGLSSLYMFEAATSGLLVALLLTHFVLSATLVLVALDGTAALAASALLRAAAARSAREWTREIQPKAAKDLEEEAERRANAALNIGFAVTFVMGPALAGVVVPTLGTPAALLIDMVSFVICGAMLLDVRPHAEDAESATVAERLRAARAHIGETSRLRRLLVAEAVALAFFEFSPPIEVVYAKASLHAGDSGYGLLLGIWGLGVAAGSVVFARSVGRSLGTLLSASTLAVGVSYIGWAVAPTLALACAAGLIGGVGNGMQWAALISAVQRLTPEKLLGQMMGAVESIGAIAPGVGFALGSGIVALSSPRVAFLVAGIGASLTTLAFVRLRLGGHAQPAGTKPDADAAPPAAVA